MRTSFLVRAWNTLVRVMYRLNVATCPLCEGTGFGCNCGCDDLPYEITGGIHYGWCMYYQGCPYCGREKPE